MLNIKLKQNSQLQKFLNNQRTDFSVHTRSPEEKVRLLIVRDLLRLGWEMSFKANRVLFSPPASYDKQIIKDSMRIRREESLEKNAKWIDKHAHLAIKNLADGELVWNSKIIPVIEVCETQKQMDVFRFFRFYWSSPYSEYVGRRIKLLIRDRALPNKPLIGIAALGSSIVHIPDRDKWIGWDKETRTRNLIYTMDAYVLGALPPYNKLLGGKLISYLMASREIRYIYQRKYKGKITNISQRTANKLACIFTTSLYGQSSQYNRLKHNDNLLYIPIGRTKGYGSLHLTDETFNAMRDLLKDRNVLVTNKFGDGPSWRIRVIRSAADILGFDSDFLLKHSFQREIYAVPLAHNSKEFLTDDHRKLKYYDYSKKELIECWKERWLHNRKKSLEIQKSVYSFRTDDFSIR